VRLKLLIAAALLVLAPPGALAAKRSPTATAPTHFVKVNGARFAYRSVGSGPTLVMIMGLGGTIDAWDPRFVDSIAHHHRVVMFDNRGAGRSGGAVADLSVKLMADDADAVIKRLRLGRPDVLGWSMGGFIAQDLALHHPHDVGRLVLAATAPHAPLFVGPTPDAIAAHGFFVQHDVHFDRVVLKFLAR
jgi:pimeloyl-ACP methyl ester carboxylesterase